LRIINKSLSLRLFRRLYYLCRHTFQIRVPYCSVLIQTYNISAQVAMYMVQLQPHRHFEFSSSHNVVAVNARHVGCHANWHILIDISKD
jgi:hypothetical protein